MPLPIKYDSIALDMQARTQISTTVQNSPIAAAAETIICTLTLNRFADIAVQAGVLVNGWCAYTIGGTPTSAQLRVRQTNGSGTVVANTGAMTGGHNTAGFLVADDVNGFDSGAGVGTYVLTLQIAGGSSNTTISAAYLVATII